MCKAKTNWLMTLLLAAFALVEKENRKKGEGKIFFFFQFLGLRKMLFRIPLRGTHIFHCMFKGKNILNVLNK